MVKKKKKQPLRTIFNSVANVHGEQLSPVFRSGSIRKPFRRWRTLLVGGINAKMKYYSGGEFEIIRKYVKMKLLTWSEA